MIRHDEQPLTARDACRMLFRHRVKCAAALVLPAVAALAYLLLTPREFLSEAQLFVTMGRETVGVDQAAATGALMVNPTIEREGELLSVVELLKSRGVFETVVDQLSPEKVFESDLPPTPLQMLLGGLETLWKATGTNAAEQRELAIRHLMRELEVEHPKKSHVVNIAYKARSAARAREIVAAYVEACLAQHMHVHKSPGSYEFFVEQAQVLEAQLLDARRQLRDAKDAIGVASIPSQLKLLEDQLSALDHDASAATADLAASQERISVLQRALSPDRRQPPPATSLTGEGINLLRSQLYAEESRVNELRATLSPDHPRIVAGEDKLRQMQEQFDYELLRAEVSRTATLQARLASLQSQYDQPRRQLKTLNEHEADVESLERLVATRANSYTTYMANMEQARIDNELHTERLTNLHVATAPTEMGKPLSRHGALVLMLAAVVGLLACLGTAYAAECLDQSLTLPQDVETHLGIPVLMSLPRCPRDSISLN